MSIEAIFYSKFDPQQGPIVVHQVPENSVLTSTDLSSSTASAIPATNNTALISFPAISRFVIPRQSLCGNLITLRPPPLTPNTPPHLILSYPQCLTSPHYHRNEFIFTFILVLTPSVDIPSYTTVLTKLAHLMSSLETQSAFLSTDPSPPQSGPIYSLLETLMMDLNNYAECMTPLHPTLNTLNIKLFPTLRPPPKVFSYHVPLFTVSISTVVDSNWDLTLQRIIPFINGVNSVKKIALSSDSDVKLVRKAVRHLVYYGCVVLLDVFSFNAVYAPTNDVHTIVRDVDMQQECARYVNMRFAPQGRAGEEAVVDSPRPLLSLGGGEKEVWPLTGKGEVVDGVGIVQLYASLRQGLTVREWFGLNSDMLANIDLRRFVTFGVIKGLLYRVRRYAVRTKVGMVSRNGERNRDSMKGSFVGEKEIGKTVKGRRGEDEEGHRDLSARISEYIDGSHCFDEICTEVEVSERALIETLKSGVFGEVSIICR